MREFYSKSMPNNRDGNVSLLSGTVSGNNMPYVQSSSVEHEKNDMFNEDEDGETPQLIGNFVMMNST